MFIQSKYVFMSKFILFLSFVLLPYLLPAQRNKMHKVESLKLEWPDSEHWKVADDQEDGPQHITDLVHENESIDKWTELGNMTSIKGALDLPVDSTMSYIYFSALSSAPDAKLTFIQKGETQDCAWSIFTIEAPGFTDDTIPESQLWYVIQGKEGLYTNFIAIKKSKLPEDFKTKWTAFFQKGRLVYN